MKRLTQATGILEDAVLLNFRTDIHVLNRILPPPFVPRLVDGYGLVGILMFKMRDLACEKNLGLPSPPSDHVLYRVAVSWQHGMRTHHGMYLLRHEVNTRLNVRQRRKGLFPVAASPIRWHKTPGSEMFGWTLNTHNQTRLKVRARLATAFPPGSVFDTLDQASLFFQKERAAIAPRFQQSIFAHTRFLPLNWKVKPLFIEALHTDMDQLGSLFPKEQIYFDSGLIWPRILCKWQKGHEIVSSRPFPIVQQVG